MDAKKIASIIAADLAQHPDFYNSHGVDVSKCLVPPARMEFKDSFENDALISMWLVLKERPDDPDGYLVVYDDTNDQFGLAIYGTTHPVFIGYYGSFTETLSGM